MNKETIILEPHKGATLDSTVGAVVNTYNNTNQRIILSIQKSKPSSVRLINVIIEGSVGKIAKKKGDS